MADSNLSRSCVNYRCKIIYSASPAIVQSEFEGGNSPFFDALLKKLRKLIVGSAGSAGSAGSEGRVLNVIKTIFLNLPPQNKLECS